MTIVTVDFTPQELADLRYFISVCVWIRGEQVFHEDSQYFTVGGQSISSELPPVSIGNDMLSVRRAQNDCDQGRAWWKRLTVLLKNLPEEKYGPSWHNADDLSR